LHLTELEFGLVTNTKKRALVSKLVEKKKKKIKYFLQNIHAKANEIMIIIAIWINKLLNLKSSGFDI